MGRYCKFSAKCANERILKIGEYLAKIRTKVSWHFLWPTEYIALQKYVGPFELKIGTPATVALGNVHANFGLSTTCIFESGDRARQTNGQTAKTRHAA